MRLLTTRLLAALCCTASLAAAVRAEEWPGFRGPLGTGLSGEKNLPLTWSETENVLWKVKLSWSTMSSPIVWKDRIFIQGSPDAAGQQRVVQCYSRADGKLLWEGITPFPDKEPTYTGQNHFCSSTPVTDGQRVVSFLGSAGMVAYSMDGKLLWRNALGPCEHIWGNASSPIIHGNLVIHNFGPGERTFLIALDKRTGKEAWRVEEPGGLREGTPQTWIGSWSSPVLAKIDGRDQVLLSWPMALKSFEPATGKLIWSCQGLTRLVYTSPLVSERAIVAMGGYGGSALAVRPGGQGDLTETNRLWLVPRNPQRIGSGCVVGDHIFMVNENGIAECIELLTGKALWQERVLPRTWSSLIHADGRLYIIGTNGETVVLAAKPTFQVLARNKLDGTTQSTPAVSDGRIIIRLNEGLYCIGTRSRE